jgi:hypothetical protein
MARQLLLESIVPYAHGQHYIFELKSCAVLLLQPAASNQGSVYDMSYSSNSSHDYLRTLRLLCLASAGVQ